MIDYELSLNHIYYVVGLNKKVEDILEKKYSVCHFKYNVYILSAVEIADILNLSKSNIRDIEVYIVDNENYTDTIEDDNKTLNVRQLISEELFNLIKDVKIIDDIEDFEDDKYYALFPINEVLEDELDEEFKFEDFVPLKGDELKEVLEDFRIQPTEVIIHEYDKNLGKEVIFTKNLY